MVPLRDPESLHALSIFVKAAAECRLLAADTETVLMRCLAIVDRYTGGRLPGLVDTYLARSHGPADALACFERCVEEVVRYRGIGHGAVQQAIEIIRASHADSTLSHPAIAARVGLTQPEFCDKFKAQTGVTFREYLRDVRLARAAMLLATTDKTVKEVWAEVGYNHPSNFNHDFRRRFGGSPREYRERVMRPAALARYSSPESPARHGETSAPGARGSVLVVDDDPGTRQTVGRYLELSGYSVVLAATGQEGLLEAAAAAPRTILLDYHLPDIDGLACLRFLRTNGADPQPAVLLFTADWELDSLADEVRALGATLVSKPCDLPELERRIAALSEP